EDVALGVVHREVHPPLLVLEDAQGEELSYEPLGRVVVVAATDPEQHQETGSDRADGLALDGHRRAAASLYERPPRRPAGPATRWTSGCGSPTRCSWPRRSRSPRRRASTRGSSCTGTARRGSSAWPARARATSGCTATCPCSASTSARWTACSAWSWRALPQ